MNETTTLNNLQVELNTNLWWTELLTSQSLMTKASSLGEVMNVSTFNLDLALESLPRTEVKSAIAIRNKFKNRLSYVAATKTWYLWDGKVHVPCTDDSVAYKVAKVYYDQMDEGIKYIKSYYEYLAAAKRASGTQDAVKEAKAIMDQYQMGEVKKHRIFRDRMSTNAGLTALVAVMKSELDIPRDYFDGDLKYFVVRNGVIDIEQFKEDGYPKLLDHDPSRPVWRWFDADFDEKALSPNWNHFLSTSICDMETAALLQKGVGAAFAGTYKPRAMFNLLGAPASGKSLFLAVFDALGQNYSVMPNNQAIQVSGSDTNFYQEALRGKRFIGFSEVQGKKALDDGFIKGIMGGDKQNTRTLHAKEAAWIPQGVMFVASNMALKIDFRDEATFNKVLPIPFPWSFTDTDPEHTLDRELEDKVLAERDGLLVWVLQGMLKFWREGLHPTEAVMAAMDKNKKSASYALQFVNELIEMGYLVQDLNVPTSSMIKMGDAYTAFGYWATGQGVKNVTGKQTFNDDIKAAYFGDANSGGRRFKGLAMTDAFKTILTDTTRLAYIMGHLDERSAANI